VAPGGNGDRRHGRYKGRRILPSGLLILWGIAIGLWLVFAAQKVAEPTAASVAA
jgi:hypothetical protein